MIKLIKALNKKYKDYQYKKALAAYLEKLEALLYS